MCLLVVFKRVLSCTEGFLVFDDVVLEASVNPVETLLVTGIRWSKCGRADRGNGRMLHMYVGLQRACEQWHLTKASSRFALTHLVIENHQNM